MDVGESCCVLEIGGNLVSVGLAYIDDSMSCTVAGMDSGTVSTVGVGVSCTFEDGETGFLDPS